MMDDLIKKNSLTIEEGPTLLAKLSALMHSKKWKSIAHKQTTLTALLPQYFAWYNGSHSKKFVDLYKNNYTATNLLGTYSDQTFYIRLAAFIYHILQYNDKYSTVV